MKEPENTNEIEQQSFLKIFRIALNFICLYSKDHKSFVSSVGDVKLQLDQLLSAAPLTIAFSTNALSVNGTVLSKKQLYVDIAKQFHFRKVKSVQFLPGVSLAELGSLFEFISLPVKEVITRGGIKKMLSSAGSVNIRIVELDYSSLLQDKGGLEDQVDSYLLDLSLEGQDPAKIKEFTQNFGTVIARVSISSIVEDKQLAANLHNFLAYVSTSDAVAFRQCVQSLFRVVLKDKGLATKEQMAIFTGFIKDLSADTIAAIIVDEAAQNEEFNSSNLSLFLQELNVDDHNSVHLSLAQSITSDGTAQRMSSKASHKLKDLFTVSSAPLVSGIYERVMETLSQNNPSGEAITFDRDHVLRNYRYILLFIFGFEQDQQKLEDIAQRICEDWPAVISDPQPVYFQILSEQLLLRREQGLGVGAVAQMDLLYRRFIEDSLWQSPLPEWLIGLIEVLPENTRDERWYLEKMFSGEMINRHSLSLFLRFFPEHMGTLCQHFEQSSGDMDFMGTVVDALRQVNSSAVLTILENIYGFSSDLIKIEVLKAMQALSDRNEDFLLPLLSEENFYLRREAMAVLISAKESQQKALNILLGNNDIWGRKNALLAENIGIVEDLRVHEAADHLLRIARRPFFWNADLRRRAQKALEVLT
jgi:hypothetical protein